MIGSWGVGELTNGGAVAQSDVSAVVRGVPMSGVQASYFFTALWVTLRIAREYGSGSINAALCWTPWRLGVVLAKMTVAFLVPAASVVLGGLLAFAGALFGLSRYGLAGHLHDGSFAWAIGVSGLSVGLLSAAAGGISMLVRSTVGALLIFAGMIWIAPLAAATLSMIGASWPEHVVRFFPGELLNSAVSMSAADNQIGQPGSVALLLGWAGVAAVAGGWRLCRTSMR
ncbi:hypothetical protein [Microlunatus sp. GCM10028923]|uniref:hypothetical protein n=1 Tax=Microlunatus sp. GCM10028923 TaxID=3273400 RepID=UPI003615EA00